jgi:Protein of unknown function (DUF1572)
MHSHWKEFLDFDGEATGRNRDAEFEDQHLTSARLWQRWNDGWTLFLGVLERLMPADLGRTLTIRGEVHTVLLARHWDGQNWQVLSIARGQGAEYNCARGLGS